MGATYPSAERRETRTQEERIACVVMNLAVQTYALWGVTNDVNVVNATMKGLESRWLQGAPKPEEWLVQWVL